MENIPLGKNIYNKKGLFLSVAASHGARLFEGAARSVKYCFDAIGAELSGELYLRGIDGKGEVLAHPEYLEMAYDAGFKLGKSTVDEALGSKGTK